MGGNERSPLGRPSFARSIGVDSRLMQNSRLATDIKLEPPKNHNDGLGSISILEQREPERLCAVDEQSTTKAMLVLNNPVAAAVPTDKEQGTS
jgi:hypothetical protein